MTHLVSQVSDVVGENMNLCYQCEKCSSGCPVAEEMELVPAQIMHGAQLNQKEKIMKANTIWLCASCETCSTRCPQGIDICSVMDGLRIIAHREHIKAKVPTVPFFYWLCLLSLKYVGCIYEMGMAGMMRLRSGTILQEMGLATTFLKKGKLQLFPHFRNSGRTRRIIKKVKKYEDV